MTQFDDILALARASRAQAYAPYSGYAVGAVLTTASGNNYSGCNVENSASPQGTCAEAGAISAMVHAGERDIRAVLVMGPSGPACTPCGGCRQKLAEFARASTPVRVCDPDALLLETTLGELLPFAFGPANVADAPDE
jgi:cytidine deaminase